MNWIDVKDQLPEIHTPVVVRVYGDAMPRIAVLIKAKLFNAKGEEIIHTKWSGVSNVRVTHWLQIPDYPGYHRAHMQVS